MVTAAKVMELHQKTSGRQSEQFGTGKWTTFGGRKSQNFVAQVSPVGNNHQPWKPSAQSSK